MYYLKMKSNLEDVRLNLIDNGISVPEEGILELSFYGANKNFETIREIFSDIDSGITVYGCIVQDSDGRETDEFVSTYFENYIILKYVEYDFVKNIYKVTLTKANELELRMSDMEEAMNFLLMGGE